MLFKYEAKSPEGESSSGTIEAASLDIAVDSLQRRNLIIVSLKPAEAGSIWQKQLTLFEKIKSRDVVILSRQLATLFDAKVPVVESLKVLASEASSSLMQKHLSEVLEDIQGGLSLSKAFDRHPEVFSKFYINMVRAGEESGKLDEVFIYLADYLERNYELTSKARNALIYPAFVLSTFFVVMTLMLIVVIPRLSVILIESGQPIPVYTQVVIWFSDFVRNFGVFFIAIVAVAAVMLWRYTRTANGRMVVSRFQLSIPIVGELYRKIYLARFADNLQTLLSGGVSVIRALDISADVVGNRVYEEIIRDALNSVKSGSSISEALARYEDVPMLLTQMIRIGEETGKLPFILETVARYYKREVDNTVENIVSLIEPVMIIVLGLGVGGLVAAVLVPIYNISSTI